MAHPITISTENCPRYLEKSVAAATNRTGKLFFTIARSRILMHDEEYELRFPDRFFGTEDEFQFRIAKHEIVSGKTEFFYWDAGSGSIVNLYCLADDILVAILYQHESNRIIQHLVQLVQAPTTVHPILGHHPYLGSDDGMGYSICTRTKTMPGEIGSTVTLAMGMVHSGVLLVTAKQSWDIHNIPSIQAHMIASNPLLIDRYPDVDLTSHVVELAEKARAVSLNLYTPIINHKGVFYLLRETPTVAEPFDDMFNAMLSTNLLGVVYFMNGRSYETKLESFSNKDIVNPKHCKERALVTHTQMNGFGYLVFKSPDMDVLNSWSWWWKKKRHVAKNLVLSTAFRIAAWLDSLDEEPQSRIEERRLWLFRRLSRLPVPDNHYVYAIDLENLKFRRLPYAKKVTKELPIPFCKAAPNGVFFIAHLPQDETSLTMVQSQPTMEVTLLWEPTNPPTLREIAERAALKSHPAYRNSSFRRSYGLLRYGEKVETADRTTVNRTSPTNSWNRFELGNEEPIIEANIVTSASDTVTAVEADTVTSRSLL